MQGLGEFRVCGRVNLVGEDVVRLGPGDGEIQASEQLGQRFTFSAPQHRQGVSSLVGHSDTFPDWRNDPDSDSAQFDYFIDVGQVGEIAC